MVCVNAAKRRESVTDNREQRNQNVVDHINQVSMSIIITTADPANEKQNPDETENCNEEGIDGYAKAKSYVQSERRLKALLEYVKLTFRHVFLETFPAALELFSPRMQQMPDVVVEFRFVVLAPIFQH